MPIKVSSQDQKLHEKSSSELYQSSLAAVTAKKVAVNHAKKQKLYEKK